MKIRCAKCDGTSSRIADVGNPWLDAGIVPFSTMKYNSDRAYWEKWFPADFITESFPGQFRNWFYAILAMSTMMEHVPPFKVLLGHGLVQYPLPAGGRRPGSKHLFAGDLLTASAIRGNRRPARSRESAHFVASVSFSPTKIFVDSTNGFVDPGVVALGRNSA